MFRYSKTTSDLINFRDINVRRLLHHYHLCTYNAGINDAYDTEYRRYRVNAQVADLCEGNGRYIDDNGQVREERDGE